MSDTALGAGPDALDETLGRLSKKPGVRATIALDRASGAILKTTGQVGSIRATPVPVSPAPGAGSFSDEANGEDLNRDQGAEQLAAMIWNFVSNAGSFVQELDTEDEVKLLRLRTKKQEFVIVPDTKYLLVVVHDTSA
ncbi:hypothetical protein B0J18DRAFT_94232 [Chaetomium sp. MPI-SDFR-AT-0129]|uniref:Roadblock/LAMTOR2 domain-containing protein n=1 Tax=Dichotomopilus funicola TaxID=1934379 RepID=A0AAN6V793_9PEZI|nr:hypothetical protein B0J18DRAFT_94232 [Chaetomium sp. MPI-SDFR-AT-0129]KAK4145335.1 hypothetical protein C8A04DRAFT_26842 [Dichotomopilus funicola]